MRQVVNSNTPPNNRSALIVAALKPEADGAPIFKVGSGAIVGQNDVLTAAHIVYKPGYETVKIGIYPAYDGSPMKAFSDFMGPMGDSLART